MNKISLIINTLNEEKHIANCINSAKELVDEIVVCDMYSDDKTVQIAESLGAKIVFHERTGFVEPARYYAISQASNNWVLVLDADERLTESLSNELVKIINSNNVDLVMFAFLYNYFGKYIKYGGFFNNNFPRLFKKEKYLELYSKKEEMVHGNFRNLEKNTKRKIILSKDFYVIHEAYPTFEKFLRKGLCNYTLIDSKGRFEKGEKVSFFKVFYIPFKEFVKRYIFLQGFREGKIGLVLCYLMSQYTYYTLLNLWFLNKNEEK